MVLSYWSAVSLYPRTFVIIFTPAEREPATPALARYPFQAVAGLCRVLMFMVGFLALSN
jgi:hypothetical protein